MRHSLFLAGTVLLAAGCASAPPAPAPTPAPAGAAAAPADRWANLPPLIDREVFFGDPEISGGQISPDGRFISFRKPNRGQINIWVKGIDEPFEAARPLTADSTRPVTGYFWSRDGKRILYVQDKGGDENFHVYAVDPAAPAATDGVPEARNLTPYGAVQAQIIAVPKATPNQILVALNDRDPAKHDVYRVNLSTGARELVFRNDEGILAFTADLAGRLRLGTRMSPTGASEVLRIEGNRATPILTLACDIFRQCGPHRFHRDNRRVYMANSAPGEDLSRLVLYDLQTGREEVVETDPERQVDFAGAEFSNATDELVATYYVGDRLRIYPKDAQFQRDLETVRAAVGDGDIYFGTATLDDRLHVVSVTSDVDPGATYLYERGSGRVELLYRPRPNLPSEHLAQMQPVRYRARDGVEIPAYLTVPKGVEPRSLPAIILPHGGPWARDMWGYDPFAQFLANRGYVVLQPNFRGSTGYGERFLDLGNNEWGTGTMQHDISDGVRWLVEQGIADPERVGIMGISYGGYATLAGLAFTPDLYAAGVSIVGPSNLVTLLQSIPPYWAPIKRTFDLRLGSLDVPEDVERLRAQSPLFSATNIRVPLLVIQGANDPRVNKAESDQIVVALRDLDREVEYLVAPDEGHGFARRENRLAMMAAIEPFLARHLGGRFQESMPLEIRERLAVLTVDPATVSVATETAATVESWDASRLQPRTLVYRFMVQGNPMGTYTSTLARDGNAWKATAALEGAPMTQQSELRFGEGLTPISSKQMVVQGPMRMETELRFENGKVVGTAKLPPQMGGEQQVDAQVPAGTMLQGMDEYLLAVADLAPGKSFTVPVFSVQSGQAANYTFRVAGEESVTVPAGTFETYKVEFSAGPQNGTVYVRKDAPHITVKQEFAAQPIALELQEIR